MTVENQFRTVDRQHSTSIALAQHTCTCHLTICCEYPCHSHATKRQYLVCCDTVHPVQSGSLMQWQTLTREIAVGLRWKLIWCFVWFQMIVQTTVDVVHSWRHVGQVVFADSFGGKSQNLLPTNALFTKSSPICPPLSCNMCNLRLFGWYQRQNLYCWFWHFCGNWHRSCDVFSLSGAIWYKTREKWFWHQ